MAATTDARHEFVTATVGLVHLRSVPVVSSEASQDAHDTGRGGSKRKPRLYRALSGVSFQNSVATAITQDTHNRSSSSSLSYDDCSYWERSKQLQQQPSTVRVTFVQRKIIDYSSSQHRPESDYEDDYEDDDAYDSDSQLRSTGVTVVTNHYDEPADALVVAQQRKGDEEDDDAAKEHIYDEPCPLDEVYADPILSDSDLSGLDLSIFEPGKCSPSEEKQAFIYRPPRPDKNAASGQPLRRSKTFRDRLRKLFNAPQPPAVDYYRELVNEYDEARSETRSQSTSPLHQQQRIKSEPLLVTDLDNLADWPTGKEKESHLSPARRRCGHCGRLLLASQKKRERKRTCFKVDRC